MTLHPSKAQRSVPSPLDRFISHRYDLDHSKTTKLCAKCHAFENQQMAEHEATDMEKNISSNDGIFEVDEQEENATEEEENGSSVTNDEVTILMMEKKLMVMIVKIKKKKVVMMMTHFMN